MNRKAVTTTLAAALMLSAILIAWKRIGRAVDLSYGLGYPGLESTLTSDYTLEPAFPELRFFQPVFLASPPADDRAFVVEKGGRIVVFENRPDATDSHEFLRIPVRDGGEQGLLGLAFAPDYGTSGYFYVYYTPKSGPRRSTLSRFRFREDDPRTADPDSELVLLEIPQPYSNHNGGMLCFGPDGNLYLGVGDGGSAGDPKGHGQNTTTLLGTIVRIRPTTDGYAIPADNPFADGSSGRPEIYAWGLRNPWRFSFDRDTGELWVGDVGQNRREEISIVRCGDNLGWDAYEGELEYERSWLDGKLQHRRPLFTYAPSIGTSVTGGHVYRGARLPGLRGAYVYGDYGSGRVWALRLEGGAVVSSTEIAHAPAVVAFAENADGELLLIGLGGKIWRLSAAGSPEPARG